MLRDEFTIRIQEIDKYFLFLQKVEEDYKIITDFSKTHDFAIDDELTKILKANGFLLLYNLIESTVFNGIVDIFDELKTRQVNYSLITSELKKFWLKTKYKNQENETHTNTSQKFHGYIEEIIQNLPIDLVIERIDYGGSIDAKKIRDLSKELGITFTDTTYKDYPNGEAFKKIRDYRNDLAHGKQSFSAIGRNLTYNGTIKTTNDIEKITQLGLIHFKKFTVEHLSTFVESVESFITNESYRK